MPDLSRDDDSWDELARELGVDKSAPPSRPPEPGERSPVVESDADDPEFEPLGEERPARGHPPDQESEAEEESDEAEGDEAGEGEPGGEETPGEGQPGTGRKRRRRRRRRKKGGAPGEGESPAGEPAAAEPGGDEPAPGYGVTSRRAEEPAPEADEEADEIEPEAAPLAAEEETGSEVLRDLIANWNVPSWDEIVGGLYRPER